MTRCKNCMRTLALALTLALSLNISVPARAAVDETNAHRLNALGLFLGTGSGYDLGGSATRLHGIIMLTRMLGEEDAALSFDGPCPFSDVAAGKPSAYTGYAFAQGYTTGVSATTFRPNGALSFKHYVTFLLRALGYDDGAGDFTFAASLEKAVEIGMMTRTSADCILQKQYALYRGDLVDLSVSALTTPLADGSATLAESLAKKGVFTWEEGRAQGLIGGGQESYVHSSLRNVSAPIPEQSASSGAVSRVTKTYALPSGSVSADVITVDTSAPGVSVRAAMVNQKLGASAPFSSIVSASGADVIVNANFFAAYSGQDKFPVGHVMADGTFLYGVSGLTSFGFTGSGEVYVGRPAVFFYVRGGRNSWACYEMNSKTQGSDLSVVYTPAFGGSVPIKIDGTATTVAGGVITDVRTVTAGETVAIPADGYVMVFGNDFTSTSWYREPAVGTSVTLTPGLTDSDTSGFPMEEITAMVSGGPRLVENGAICTTLEPGFQEARFTSAVTSRTALGKLADGKLVIVSTGSASIQQLRELMLQLGCVEAVNLDGGGSTALAYQGKLIRSPGRELTTTLQIFTH